MDAKKNWMKIWKELEKQSKIIEVSIDETNHIRCKQANIILEDGIEISRKYHIANYYPGQNFDISLFNEELSEEDQVKIQKAFDSYHTPEVIQNYKDSLKEIDQG